VLLSKNPLLLVLTIIATLVAVLSVAAGSIAQEAKRSESDLARQLQNPLTNSTLLRLPLQRDFSSYTDRNNPTQTIISANSMIPFSFTPGWNTNARSVSPVFTGKSGAGGFGIRDLSLSALVTPADVPTVTWGLGPALSFPAANSAARNDKRGVGISGAAVYSLKAWVGGVFISNTWSFEGSSPGRNANQMVVQPFLNYNLSKGWYLTSAPAITVDWQSNGSEAWTVPVGGGVGKVVSLYGQMFNLGAQGYVYPVHPAPGNTWAVQTTLQWLFPH
jgi:hypothetical protein